ncbi:MAG TPA: hypothetical protein VFY99_01670 [Solirubrobacterales bacterium]
MRLGNLANKAKQAVDKRGGMDALKGDAAELKEIAKGKGSLKEKAKAAGDAVKKPGKAEEPPAQAPAGEPTAGAPTAPQPDKPAPPAGEQGQG